MLRLLVVHEPFPPFAVASADRLILVPHSLSILEIATIGTDLSRRILHTVSVSENEILIIFSGNLIFKERRRLSPCGMQGNNIRQENRFSFPLISRFRKLVPRTAKLNGGRGTMAKQTIKNIQQADNGQINKRFVGVKIHKTKVQQQHLVERYKIKDSNWNP